MRFTKKINAAAGATTADPRTNPQDVPPGSVFMVDASLTNSGTAPRKTLITLEGQAGDTATVQLWVLDDAGFGEVPQVGDYPDLQWYSLGSPVALTVGANSEGDPMPAGVVYAEITIGPTNAAVVKIGSAP